MMAASLVVRPSPETLWRRVPDGLVLLSPRGGEPVVITGTSLALWDALGSGCRLSDLLAHLADRYQAEPEAIRADVDGAVERLASAGLVSLES